MATDGAVVIRQTSSLRQALRVSPLAALLAVAILVSWIISAVAQDQSVFAVQPSRWLLALVFLVAGTIGHAASVIAYPDLVSSGASQALMGLCGAALVLGPRRQELWLVAAIIVVQAALDLQSVQAIKAGHSAAFTAGLLLAGAILVATPLSPRPPRN
jgi:membrane associated rhomboid family serine protease